MPHEDRAALLPQRVTGRCATPYQRPSLGDRRALGSTLRSAYAASAAARDVKNGALTPKAVATTKVDAPRMSAAKAAAAPPQRVNSPRKTITTRPELPKELAC